METKIDIEADTCSCFYDLVLQNIFKKELKKWRINEQIENKFSKKKKKRVILLMNYELEP